MAYLSFFAGVLCSPILAAHEAVLSWRSYWVWHSL